MTLLGRNTPTPGRYAPEVLDAIPRAHSRGALGIADDALPFTGEDTWHAWELSWLGQGGVPAVGVGRLVFPCDVPNLVESKSLKLYLNSLYGERFSSGGELAERVAADVSAVAAGQVRCEVLSLADAGLAPVRLPGQSLDSLEPGPLAAEPDPQLLEVVEAGGEQCLHTHLFRSLCPVTAQPDWASIVVQLSGAALEPRSLLAYLLSFREHAEFHEQCVERIFVDIARATMAESIAVQAFYTRRGGLDINPWRATAGAPPVAAGRTVRQ